MYQKPNKFCKKVKMFVLLFICANSFMQAQTSPSTNSSQSVQTDGSYGPTLIICSNKDGNYEKSVTKFFGIDPNGGNQIGDYGYKMVRVGGTAPAGSGLPHYQYLNQAISTYLGWYFKRIIVLAGDYEVNGVIILDKADAAIGNVTIEGEGFGTKINPAGGYTGNIFEVKSHYNTIKNLAIHIEGSGTGIYVAEDSSPTPLDVYHNVFENLYIGHKALTGNTQQTDVAARGIVLDGQYKDVGYNKFSNIVIKGLHTGITFRKGAVSGARIHDNVFTNVNFARVVRGIFFDSTNLQETGPGGVIIYDDVADNIFTNFSLQTASITQSFVHNIYGRNNTFSNFKAADWGISNSGIDNRSFFSIFHKAQHTTIQNSEVGRGSVQQIRDGITNLDNIEPSTLIPSKYLQLINNYGGNSDVTYKLGNDKNPNNTSAISLVEILGKLKISGNDANNDTTFSNNYVLTSDANGNATWKVASTNNLNPWDYNANKNIKMNGWAITGNDNSSNNTTAPGIRLDNTGNVRIGTAAPFTTNPAKLQVDGRVFIGTPSQATNDYDANYKLLVNGKVLVRNEVYVKQGGIGWPDYVFAKDYKLMPLQKVAQHIQEKGYLPNMPSAAEVEKDGIAVGDLIKRQQEKIEELTLYLIEMKKQNDDLQKRMEALENNKKN
jgi:hypothetical protein